MFQICVTEFVFPFSVIIFHIICLVFVQNILNYFQPRKFWKTSFDEFILVVLHKVSWVFPVTEVKQKSFSSSKSIHLSLNCFVLFWSQNGKQILLMNSAMWKYGKESLRDSGMWKCGMEPFNATTGKTDLYCDLNVFNGEGKWLHFACSLNLDILRSNGVVPKVS